MEESVQATPTPPEGKEASTEQSVESLCVIFFFAVNACNFFFAVSRVNYKKIDFFLR